MANLDQSQVEVIPFDPHAKEKWRGIPQEWLELIHNNARRRVQLAYAATYPDKGMEHFEDIDIPLGVIEIVAEEVIKGIPGLALLDWEGKILTPEKIRKTKRGRRG